MEFSTGSFVAATLFASYICNRCYTAPNPPPRNREGSDTIMNSFMGKYSHMFNAYMVVVLGAYYAYLALVPPTEPSAACPNSNNVNPRALNWYPFTTISLITMLVAGAVRLTAYSELGENFTFELAPPSRLTTTGLYRYVQHPSYTTKALVSIALTLFYLRDDGPLGCWLPKAAVDYRLLSVFVWVLKWATGKGNSGTRVQEEEAMLKRTFGKEWVDYNARTARFIPFIY